MPKILTPIIAILCITFFLFAEPENDVSTFKLDSQMTALLDNAGQRFVDDGYLSGGVSLIAHNGRLIYQKAFGMQSIEDEQPMQLNSLFRIASMTKPITAVAVLLLVEEGKLRLDDYAEAYLPQFAKIHVLMPDSSLQKPRQAVTIRHLLMHTSGTRSRGDAWFKQNKIPVSSAASLETYVDLLLKAPLKFHPGVGFNYAMNNDICARIVEIVTGHNYGDFLKDRIFNPLQMNSTWFIVPDSALNRLSSIYGYQDGNLILAEGKEAVQSAFPRGNGQLVSTAGDYMNFLQMLVNDGIFEGKRFLKAETLQLMLEDHLPQSIPLKVGNTIFPNTGFGLSIAISRNTKTPWQPMPVKFENLFQHLPKGSFLWPGITNTFFWVDPANKVIGVVLSQFSNPAIVGNFQTFTQEFYRQYFNFKETE